jgi:SpoVK/Ycf46/Vps4 family AAA+-type ATPase
MTELPLAADNLGEQIICNVAKNGRRPNMRPPKIKLSDKNKPIMTPDTELQIEAAMAQYNDRGKWKQWGLDAIRKQGAAILLHGEPGTGKTVIAEYMAAKVNRGIVKLNMKDVGGKAPGHTERGIAQVFGSAKAAGNKTIYLDECEALLWDRGRAGSDSMWMVGVIDELLMQIAEYKGLVILASNYFDLLDSALVSRMLAVVKIGAPEHPERVRIWIQKLPDRFLKLTRMQIEELAQIPLTGRDIENAIFTCANMCIVQKHEPTFEALCNAANMMKRKGT